MNPAYSLYLDLVRFAAAALVFLHHWVYPRLSGGGHEYLGAYSEDAVMIFFVLSGYVISHVAVEQRNTLRGYGVSRLARLYSVVVPALLLTALFDTVGRQLNPVLYDGWWYQDTHAWFRALVSLGFLNHLWTFSLRFFSNGPFWSVCYEFWYYVLFGIALFVHGRKRWIWLTLCALFVGPQILLLFPVWLLGVWVHRFTRDENLSAALGWCLAIVPVVAYIVYRKLDVTAQLTAASDAWVTHAFDPKYLHKARFFLHDYIVGVLVAAHFVGVHALARHGQFRLAALATPIRYIASFTFTLYLLHYPLLHLLAAVSPWPIGDLRSNLLLVLGTAVVVWLVGSVTERRKQIWRRTIAFLWDWAAQRLSRRAPVSAAGETAN